MKKAWYIYLMGALTDENDHQMIEDMVERIKLIEKYEILSRRPTYATQTETIRLKT